MESSMSTGVLPGVPRFATAARPLASPLVPAGLMFILALPLFYRLIESGDHPTHMGIALRMAEGKAAPPHPLFHWALIALVGRTSATAPGAAALLLALAVAARAGLTARALRQERTGPLVTLLACVALALAIPLPNWWHYRVIIGQPSANVWHNPTFLAAAPFALWLFLEAVQLLNRVALWQAAVVGTVMALSLLAKPNYVLAFGPCFVPSLVGVVRRAWRERDLTRVAGVAVLVLALLPATAVAVWQAWWLEGKHPASFGSPLVSWHRLSPNIPGSILVGVAYPLAVAFFYRQPASGDQALTLAWKSFGVAVATFALMDETSGGHGNWGWGLHLTTAVLFVATTAFLLRQAPGWRRWLCLALLAAHAASGAFHLERCLARGFF
jgi:hypothetical protein